MKAFLRRVIAVITSPLRVPGWVIQKKQHVAVGMAIIAVFAAAAAFRAAVAEQEVSRLERKLDQGQMLELMLRQDLLDRFAQFPHFRDSVDFHLSEGQSLQREAEHARATDPAGAAVLDLEAQEEFAIARSLVPFLQFAKAGLDPDHLEYSADERVKGDLRAIGFETFATARIGPGGPQESIWTHLKNEIDKVQASVSRLARAGVAFVLGLVFLTFAQLFRHHPRVRKVLAWLGYLVVLAGLGYAIERGWDSFKTFGRFSLGIPILLCLGWMLSASVRDWESLKTSGWLFRWIGEHVPNWVWELSDSIRSFFLLTEENEESEDEPIPPANFAIAEGPIEHVHVGDAMQPAHRLRRTVLGLLALTAFLSALNGSFYSQSTIKMNKAESEAIADQVEQIKNSSIARTQAYNLLGSLAAAQESRIRYFAGLQRSEDFPLARVAMPIRQYESPENRRWRQVRAAQGRLDLLEGPLGPDRDPDFPAHLVLGELTKQRETSFAKWDGENEISLAWRNGAIAYLRTLTLFAIALYLFGQALSMGRTRAAFTLAFWAFILMAGGEFRALWVIHQSHPPDESDVREAAGHYGAGREFLVTAHTNKDFAKAVEEFQPAVDARPNFALANYYLSVATTGMGTPQVGGDYISLHSRDSLESIASHQESAKKALIDQQLSMPSNVLTNHCWNKVLLAFAKRDLHYLTDSMEDARKVVTDYADDAVDDFNLGFILLADGKKKDREEAISKRYKTGLLDLVNDSDETARDGKAEGALTDLQLLKDNCTDLHKDKKQCDAITDSVVALKACIDRAAWTLATEDDMEKCAKKAVDPDPKPQNAVVDPSLLSELKLVASPAGLGWHAVLGKGVDRDRDTLTVLWYAWNQDWGTWWILPKVSGNVSLKPGSSASESTGEIHDFQTYLENSQAVGTHNCLPGSIDSRRQESQGFYSAEFYLNGRRVAAPPHVTLAAAQYVPAVVRTLNLAMCYPENWQPWQMPDGSDVGFARGFIHPDGDRGVFLFSYFNLGQNRAQSPDPAATQRFIQKSQNFLVAKGFAAPAQLTPMPAACTNFPAKPGVAWLRYQGEGEALLAKSWTADDGMVHVGIVFRRTIEAAPPDDPDQSQNRSIEDCGVLASLTVAH
ncbi:MAG: hypothetical protein ACRD59_17315 [Candidatus Acidiferrales bacterium]